MRLNQRFLSLNHSADTWAIYYNFDQYLWNPTISSDSKGGSEVDPTRVVGIFGRIGLADESTNPIAQFYSFGLGGKGACASRPWMFDSEGGFGEGTWTHEGNKWLIAFKATAPDGSTSSAQHIVTYLDEKKYTWESISRQRDGEVLPNLDKIEVVRAAAQ